MKNYELIAKLMELPAGYDVEICITSDKVNEIRERTHITENVSASDAHHKIRIQ